MNDLPAKGGLETEFGETEAQVRAAASPVGRAVYWIGVGVSLAFLWFNTFATLPELWVSALHFAAFGLMAALVYPVWHARTRIAARWILVADVIVGAVPVAVAVYLIGFEDALYERGQNFMFWDWVASAVAVITALELTRRAVGWFIPALIVVALTYVVWWGQIIGGVFAFPGLSLETVLFRSYFSTEGMFGQIANISWSFVFMFILFGAFLVRSGAGDFIIDLARAAAGRFVGGPGLVAVLGSGLMGSVSGSAVGNTVSTGVMTIPLMKRAGFDPKFAAGTEAAASTGGQLMPPVMGAGAFVMANFTGVSYLTIVAVSVLPAVLYFLSVAFFVRIEARRRGATGGMDGSENLGAVFKRGWHFLIPLGVLVGLLANGYTPTYAAGFAIVAVVAASWLSPRRMGPRAVLDALAQGARNMTSTAVLLIAIGLVVMVVGTTGIGNTFSLMVTNWAGGSLLITIVLVAIASLVLGMGLPVTASYIVLGTLSAPAIYNLMVDGLLIDGLVSGSLPEQARALLGAFAPQAAGDGPLSPEVAAAALAGLDGAFKALLTEQALDPTVLTAVLLSAHLIIFWLSQDSNVTPPVCLTAFAAAGIAGTRPMATGLTAWKIAKGLYIIPLLFAYTPLIGGAPLEVLQVFFFATFGLYAAAGMLEGYLEGPLGLCGRLAASGAALALLWPHGIIWVSLAGLGMLAFLVPWSRHRAKVDRSCSSCV